MVAAESFERFMRMLAIVSQVHCRGYNVLTVTRMWVTNSDIGGFPDIGGFAAVSVEIDSFETLCNGIYMLPVMFIFILGTTV